MAGNLIGAKRKVLLSRSEEHIEGKDITATNPPRVIPILLRQFFQQAPALVPLYNEKPQKPDCGLFGIAGHNTKR
jgi:hypothetical protein